MATDRTAWTCSGDPPEFEAHDEYTNYGPICAICGRPRPQKQTPGPGTSVLIAAGILVSVLILGAGAYLIFKPNQSKDLTTSLPQDPKEHKDLTNLPPQDSKEHEDDGPRSSPPFGLGAISSGQVAFWQSGDIDKNAGIDFFAKGNYTDAVDSFAAARVSSRNDPEVSIYLENAKARLAEKSPYVLGIVVPVTNSGPSAEEMLRGIADAQRQFNNDGGINGKLLEVMIANDGNNQDDYSSKVARDLLQDKVVLGVIGHNASGATKAGLSVYAGRIPVISPTSSATTLEGRDGFFRTVPSDRETGKFLAAHIRSVGLSSKDCIIFYDSNSGYSNSLTNAFLDELGVIDAIVDLNEPESFDENLQNLEKKAAILFPSTKTRSRTFTVIDKNAKLGRLKLFGADALYTSDTLRQAPNSEGMILAVPWFRSSTSAYAGDTERVWGGPASWRHALSYDATLAFIEAFRQGADSRESLLEELKSVGLAASETSGVPLEFDVRGNRSGEPVLVEIVKGSVIPGSKIKFDRLQ